LSGWLLHHLLSCLHLLSTCAFTSHLAPLTPLVWLVVVSPLVTPLLPPICQRLHLSLFCRLSLCPPCASCLAGSYVISCYAAASHLPAPLPLIAPPPLTAPLSSLLSGWLLHHLSSRHRLPPACTSASQCTATSHCTPLARLVRLVVASPLITPMPPVCQCLQLLLHSCLLLRPSHASHPLWLVVV
jgi:hypothetical protein